ncbi:MAG: glycosidase [Melioribacteraceae bacterium]|nr:glycosidase [Melioribacteraceae bacterium]MCF8354878.1 glycosidase [Melioribacteraceae bacterium]MCF8393900.1 glycosidase [Melioribacteraceae bacterium]MCF8419672.1 glycosidase [Melioribacteraceae bacterium]
MHKNPSIYEINTRVWLRRFDNDKKATLKDVPAEYWQNLKEKGIDIIWLMGIWKTCKSTISKYCFEEGLIQEYNSALKNWSNEDVIGSPYAIDVYEINPDIGTEEELTELKRTLNLSDIKLVLDFIPNHFSADSSLLNINPNIFLRTDELYFNNDPYTYYKPFNDDRIFAHGRDPFFPAWQDTLQVNYFSNEAREYMIKTLVNLTKYCDGVRCDMAMLSLNNIFKNTWGGVLSKMGFEKPKDEFWKIAINIVKGVHSEFLFLAEAYWDLEWELQQLGFNYTYDKKLTDRLKGWDVPSIHDHLHAEYDYQIKSVRFIENHDEYRAAQILGVEKSKAAAVLISTVQGMHFYHDGQFEGKKIKLPVQLGREPIESINPNIAAFYEKLLSITKEEIFKEGTWTILETESPWESNATHNNILVWIWKHKAEKRLVIINYSEKVASCRIRIDVRGYPEEFEITDLLNDQLYVRSAEEVNSEGLYVKLNPFQSHIFTY